MTNRRAKMMALARRHPTEIVFEPSLRRTLIKEGLLAEYKSGTPCAGGGCKFCAVVACPTCGRVDMKGDVIFLVDREPHVLMVDQAVKPHAPDPVRAI